MLESNLIPRYDLKRVQVIRAQAGAIKARAETARWCSLKRRCAKRTEGKLDEKGGERVKERGKSRVEKGKNRGKKHTYTHAYAGTGKEVKMKREIRV